MIFKHSLKSIIRTPKKTILFLFLLMVLTVFLSIGAGMYGSAVHMFKDAGKTFTSVVQLDYLGDPESDESAFYQKMNSELSGFDFNKLEQHSSVKSTDMEKIVWAYIEGDAVKQKNSPLRDYTVITIGSIRQYENSPDKGTVGEVLFNRRVRPNTYVLLNENDSQGNPRNYEFIYDHKYLIIGKITNGRNPTLIISPGLPEDILKVPEIVDLTENPDFFLSEEGKQIIKMQEAMAVVDSSYEITAVSSLEASKEYFMKEMQIDEGRIFDQSEYEEGNNEVIIISRRVADFYQVKVGDMLPLRLHYNADGEELSDFLINSEYSHEAKYKIVGIVKSKEDSSYRFFIPDSDWINQKLHSQTLVRYIVKNGSGEEFIEDNSTYLLPNMQFTLFDQGYSEAIKPIIALKNAAILIIILGSLSGSGILILFAYLYVVKQKETLRTMLSLGTGKSRTMGYILYGSAVLVLCSSLAGAVFSGGLLNKVTGRFFDSLKSSYGSDVRYSERAIGLQSDFSPQVKVDSWIPYLIAAGVLLVSVILLFFFTYSVLREDRQLSLPKERRKERQEKGAEKREKLGKRTELRDKVKKSLEIQNKEGIKPDKRSRHKEMKNGKVLFGKARPVSFKFAYVSLVRSPGRSLIIPVISLLLSVFIIFLGLLSRMQQEKLDTVYDRIPVSAYLTTYKNETRNIAGLSLQYDIYRLIDPKYFYRMEWTRELADDYFKNGEFNSLRAQEEREKILGASEFYDRMYLYTSLNYEFMGISKTKEGEEDTTLSALPNVRKHMMIEGYDWFLEALLRMQKLAYADDLRYTPDFFNESDPEVDFLDGYDYDSLQLREEIGMISQKFADQHGIEKGDTIRITAWFGYATYAVCSVIDFKVIGIYDQKWRPDTIYLPWIMSYDHNFYVDNNYPAVGDSKAQEKEIWNEVVPRNVRAATFLMKNTDELASCRDLLQAEGYSQVGSIGMIRNAVVIQDKNLVETILNLRNHIRLINLLKPILLFLFGIIGFAVSFILIRHRTNELAIMRSMGAKKRQVFFSFFLEQLILFFLGLVPAAVYALLYQDQILLYGTSLIYFILSYLTGAALALIVLNGAKILDILFTKE